MRPTLERYMMNLAEEVAKRATCDRRSVGCVLADSKGRVLATGYNGVPSGWPHCSEGNYCPGRFAESGSRLDECDAIHAEQNALLQCKDIDGIHTAYCTASPCVTCTKLLINTGCQRIVFLEEYPQPRAQELWKTAGRIWRLL